MWHSAMSQIEVLDQEIWREHCIPKFNYKNVNVEKSENII